MALSLKQKQVRAWRLKVCIMFDWLIDWLNSDNKHKKLPLTSKLMNTKITLVSVW
jgi:hypothetical protein